jgi:hypothetical protein
VVEDRAPGQPDGVFEPAHGGPVVAVLGKAPAGTVEDLTASRRQVVVGYPGQLSLLLAQALVGVATYDFSMLRSTY